MTQIDHPSASRLPMDHDRTHPRAAAALLMTGVILVILVLAAISTFHPG